MANIFLASQILLLLQLPNKGSWNHSARYEKLGKHCISYCIRNHATTNAYRNGTLTCKGVYCSNGSVISQIAGSKAKGNFKTGVSRKQSTPNFPKNEHLLPPDTHTYVCVSGGKKCWFSEKFGGLCFLKHLWPPCNVSKNTGPLIIFEQIFYLLLVTFLLPFFTLILANMCKVKKRMNLHTSLQILGVVEAWRYLHGWSNFSRFTFSFSH